MKFTVPVHFNFYCLYATIAFVLLFSFAVFMHDNRHERSPGSGSDTVEQNDQESSSALTTENYKPERERFFQSYLKALEIAEEHDVSIEDKIIRAPWRDNDFKDTVISKPTLLN